MQHIDWILLDDIVLDNDKTLANRRFITEVSGLSKIRLLKNKRSYFLRHERDGKAFWSRFVYHINKDIYFGNVSSISDKETLEQFENDFKKIHREEVLKNLLK